MLKSFAIVGEGVEEPRLPHSFPLWSNAEDAGLTQGIDWTEFVDVDQCVAVGPVHLLFWIPRANGIRKISCKRDPKNFLQTGSEKFLANGIRVAC